MKEYKVVSPTLGFRNRLEKLEDFLNKHARESWIVKDLTMTEGGYVIIFERNKNR